MYESRSMNTKVLVSFESKVSRLDRRLSHEQIRTLSLVSGGLGIGRQDLEAANSSLMPLFGLLQRNAGSDVRAFALLVWMLERIGCSHVRELKQHPRYEPLEGAEREFVGVDFLLTVHSVFADIPEEEYANLLHLVTKEHLDGLSPDKVPTRTDLIQRMLDKELIREDEIDLLYRLLNHYQLNRLARILNEYCSRHDLEPRPVATQGELVAMERYFCLLISLASYYVCVVNCTNCIPQNRENFVVKIVS